MTSMDLTTHSTVAEPSAPGLAGLQVDVDAAVKRACELIAPTWPLDRFIAVNPFWSRIDRPVATASAELTALCGSRLLMPRAWFREEWRSDRLRAEHLREAIARTGSAVTLAQLQALLESEAPEPEPEQRLRVMDVVDSHRELTHAMSWRDFVVHNTSQFCAAYFDDGQAEVGPHREGGLFASWRRQAMADRSPSFLMGLKAFRDLVRELPQTARELVPALLTELGVPAAERESYLVGLLLDLNGWSAWCAYRRWTARLSGGEDDHLVELLAIRLAWEGVLFRSAGNEIRSHWRRAMTQWPRAEPAARASQAHDWLLQEAIEIAWQTELCRRLPAGLQAARATEPAAVQAVFCIDVRSEVYRRALEAQGPGVQTLGFAGFFGVPMEYQPIGAVTASPQLPGLLAPRFRATDTGTAGDLPQRRQAHLALDATWKAFKVSPLSSFSFVESMGVLFAGKLLGDSFSLGSQQALRHGAAGLSARDHAERKPRLTARADGTELTSDDRCQLAEGVLRAMSLSSGFAELVLLVGHGSETRNNPHAAGLDCGACGGQTGEANARVAAALLNQPEVRAGLLARGLAIPPSTHFVAALHNTTTDEVKLFELDEAPPAHRAKLDELQGILAAASIQARRERAPSLGLGQLSDQRLKATLIDRARDWAQVRPEWGLVNNAAFIIAPRERSRHLDLGGRSFLHDYRFEDDPGFAVLELIMTAPMLVTHWINFQYYASTVDQAKYGSGNKVLHNVVGGHLGVFEGNGGDLRIGLPMQSLHDGERWVHTPLRLSVFIEAPEGAIDAILHKHAQVRALVDNEWLHLFQLDAAAGLVRAYRQGRWVAGSPPPESAAAPPLDPVR